ncbi:ribosomal protein S5 domain 2-type protein [Phlyctochytrium arcticum]|nr:ribosomal protein S5 domain 2-type protein [Phlyctochytrium arcticum]
MSDLETEKENRQLQQEEFLALSSIYGSDFVPEPLAPTDTADLILHSPPGSVILRCHFPTTYPSHEAPYYELVTDWRNRAGVAYGLPNSFRERVDSRFRDVFVEGEVVVFEWVAALEEMLEEEYGRIDDMEREAEERRVQAVDTADAIASAQASTDRLSDSRPASADAADDPTADDPSSSSYPMTLPPNCPPITMYPEPIIDRKSKFVAHLAPVTSTTEVALVLQALRSNKRIMKATHPTIYAYRIVEESTGVMRQDCDDDGETAAGSRLLHLLQLADAKNVMVNITRWYGGTHLGPTRFKHINNAARNVLEANGYIGNSSGAAPGGGGKKGKKGR